MESLKAGDPQQLGGYRLRARLGAGGMGQVFLGYSPAGRAVAVKVIHRELARDPEFRTRFRREVAAAKAVSGAYTAPVTAAGPDDDPPWLATAYVPGPSLAEAVAAAGPLPAESVWKLAAGLVEALQAVHACGLVHRDLKPANVLLALDGPRVIDFGISRALERTAMTSTGTIVGTPSFMSPEQAEGARVGRPSDVFSLGGVIVFAATGAGPFGDGPQASMLYRVVHAAPVLGGVPDGLRELAAACLAKVPAERPELAALVDVIAADRPPDAGPAGGPPDAGAALASFWPAAVTGLIRSHQTRLSGEIRHGSTGLAASPQPGDPIGAPGAAGPATAVAGSRPVTARQASARPPAAPPGEFAAVPAGEFAASPPSPFAAAPPGQPTAIATVGSSPPAGPALTMDGLAGGPAEGPPGPGVARRRVLVGLAVVVGAGLAGAGWELSQGGAAQHQAGGSRPTPGTKTSRPTSQPSPAAGVGTSIWDFPTGGQVAGIAVAGNIVFAGSTDGKVYALRASNGAHVWDFPTGGPVRSGIAVAGGIVYAGSNDSNLYALRASNGHKLWNFPTSGSAASSIVVADGGVFTGSGAGTLYGLRASNGRKLWDLPGGAGEWITAAGGTVYAAAGDDMVVAVRASDGRKLWNFPTGAGGAIGIAVAGDSVYAGSGDGMVYALRAKDGSKLWGFPVGDSVQSGIAVAGGIVYAGSNNNKVYALRAKDGSKLWDYPTDGSVTSGIVVAGAMVYAGCNGYTVYGLRADNGAPVWKFPTGGPVDSAIAVAGGIVYVGSNDGKVYALRG